MKGVNFITDDKNRRTAVTKKEYKLALTRSMEIFNSENDREAVELDLLLVLIRDYEDKHISLPALYPDSNN